MQRDYQYNINLLNKIFIEKVKGSFQKIFYLQYIIYGTVILKGER